MKPLHTKSELSYHYYVTTSAGKQHAATSWHTNFFSGLNYLNAGLLPLVLHTEHPEAGEHTRRRLFSSVTVSHRWITKQHDPLHTKSELSYHHHVTISAGKQLALHRGTPTSLVSTISTPDFFHSFCPLSIPKRLNTWSLCPSATPGNEWTKRHETSRHQKRHQLPPSRDNEYWQTTRCHVVAHQLFLWSQLFPRRVSSPCVAH